jgi:hypothetical protein
MVGRFSAFFAVVLGLAVSAPARPPAREARAPDGHAVPGEAIDRLHLLPADIALLDDPGFKWQHLQTEHFVLHHDQRMFAARVARLGEQFYQAISADLPDLRDRIAPARSHIFIFRNARDWQAVVAATPGLDPWTASFVRGNAMYLQELGTTPADKMGLLAHEMTHLVFNRFLPVRLPLWLNEGLAEYYGEFAYRVARGMGQSRRNAFPPLRRQTPLPELFAATTYPADPSETATFYATSKYLVGYLLLRQPRAKWNAFFDRVLNGEEAVAALLAAGGWPDVAALERDFTRFTR